LVDVKFEKESHENVKQCDENVYDYQIPDVNIEHATYFFREHQIQYQGAQNNANEAADSDKKRNRIFDYGDLLNTHSRWTTVMKMNYKVCARQTENV
jgi:hypothetical protein